MLYEFHTRVRTPAVLSLHLDDTGRGCNFELELEVGVGRFGLRPCLSHGGPGRRGKLGANAGSLPVTRDSLAVDLARPSPERPVSDPEAPPMVSAHQAAGLATGSWVAGGACLWGPPLAVAY